MTDIPVRRGRSLRQSAQTFNMFFGTTPNVVSRFLYKHIKEMVPNVVHVPFSGNFVVEKITSMASPNSEIHGRDVNLYSRLLGDGLSNNKSDTILNPDKIKEFPVWKGNLNPIQKAASALFFSEIATYAAKSDKPYYRKMYKNAVHNQQEYYDACIRKFELFKEGLKINFVGEDACKLIQGIKKNEFVFYDPPVLLGDYEKMYQQMQQFYIDLEPDYTEMTDEIKHSQLTMFMDKEIPCVYRTNHIMDNPPKGFKEIFRHQYKYDAFYCLYSNKESFKHCSRFSPLKEESGNYQIIGRDDIISRKSKINIIPTNGKVSNHYRIMWIRKARMTDMGKPYLIFIDEKLIGLAQVNSGQFLNNELSLIVSDPATPTSRYKRLSRLVLHIILSEPFIEMINEDLMWKHTGFTTKVFTNAHSSQKYRGIMKLQKKEVAKNGNYKHSLFYQKRDGFFKSYKEALSVWIDKYGNQTK